MRFGSVCSGIEAASVAWHPLGWRAAWLSEIEKFPAAVLDYHYPDTPNLGDMTALPERVLSGEIEAPDVLVGGTPCQAFSVAGLRNSLEDDRGLLTLKFVELANAIDSRRDSPCTIVWENVPGVLSTKDNAFGCFLAALVGEDTPLEPPGKRWTNAGCVYGPQRTAAWRILDAQYFGVAQRRRRVFIVASAAPGLSPAKILFEREGVRRDTPPSREKGERVAAYAIKGAAIGRKPENGPQYGEINPESCYTLNCTEVHGVAARITGGIENSSTTAVLTPKQPYPVENCLTQRMHKGINTTLDERQTPVLAFHHNAQPDQMNFSEHTSASLTCSQHAAVCQYGDVAGGLTARHDSSPCADRGQNVVAIGLLGDETPKFGNDVMPTLRAEQGGEGRCVATTLQVRRLLPEECETLQGFPRGYTRIPWRGKTPESCPDGPRYKALGNSMAVPVMRWIGARIEAAKRGLIK